MQRPSCFSLGQRDVLRRSGVARSSIVLCANWQLGPLSQRPRENHGHIFVCKIHKSSNKNACGPGLSSRNSRHL